MLQSDWNRKISYVAAPSRIFSCSYDISLLPSPSNLVHFPKPTALASVSGALHSATLLSSDRRSKSLSNFFFASISSQFLASNQGWICTCTCWTLHFWRGYEKDNRAGWPLARRDILRHTSLQSLNLTTILSTRVLSGFRLRSEFSHC